MLKEIKLINFSMATEIVGDMRKDTSKELERIREEVVIVKEELRIRFEYYFQVLRNKHLELEVQLDEVVRWQRHK